MGALPGALSPGLTVRVLTPHLHLYGDCTCLWSPPAQRRSPPRADGEGKCGIPGRVWHNSLPPPWSRGRGGPSKRPIGRVNLGKSSHLLDSVSSPIKWGSVELFLIFVYKDFLKKHTQRWMPKKSNNTLSCLGPRRQFWFCRIKPGFNALFCLHHPVCALLSSWSWHCGTPFFFFLVCF